MKKSFFITLFVLAFVVFLYFYLDPLIFVGRAFISPQLTDQSISATLHAAQKLKGDTKLTETEINGIKGATIQSLIEDVLISKKLETELDRETLNSLIQNKLEAISPTSELKQGLDSLYGLTADQAIPIIFLPQAKRDILRSQFVLKGESADDWLKNEEKNKKIIIFSRDFKWENGEVKER